MANSLSVFCRQARMRLALILAVSAAMAVSSHLPPRKLNSSKVISSESDTQCKSGFYYYNGWCVYSTNPTEYFYEDAVNICANVGEFAPSIHSQKDIDFWSTFAAGLTDSQDWHHFWLDAHCVRAGDPYLWLDGTPTDYYGPKYELQSCAINNGYHMHSDGLVEFGYNETPAPAVCAYSTLETSPSTAKATTLSTTTYSTTIITTTTTTTPTPIDVTSDYCSCSPNTIYLDIVFVVDTSDDMTVGLVGDATATIQSTLYGLTFGTGMFQANVAIVAFAESVQTVVNFGGFKTSKDITSFSLPFLGGNSDKMAEALKQASSMINSNGRDFTRGVIVLLTNSFDQRHASNIDEAARAFQDDDGIIITIDYSTGLGIQGLEDITSAGYYINDTSTNPDLDADALYALCDANCFCKDGLSSYNVANERGRSLPKGCYHVSGFSAVYDAADDNCHNMDGFVATVHDDEKNFFMISLFPPKSRYWLGYRKNGTSYEWADQSNDRTTYWAAGNPISGQDCVYGQQQSGFNSLWFSAPCTDPLKNSMPYACQLRPCGSDYDCWN